MLTAHVTTLGRTIHDSRTDLEQPGAASVGNCCTHPIPICRAGWPRLMAGASRRHFQQDCADR